MATQAFATESAVYRVGQDIENRIAQLEAEGKTPQEAKLMGVEEYAIECAMLKVKGSEVGQMITDEGVQIFGGMGFSADTPMDAAYRDVRITRIYEGTNEINRMLVVGMLLKKAMKGELDLMSPAMAVANDLMAIPSFDTPDFSETLSQEADLVRSYKKAILMVAGKAIEIMGMQVEEEQEILMTIADMLIETFNAQSAVIRAVKIEQTQGAAAAEYYKKMATLAVFEAGQIIETNGKEAIISFAEGDDQRLLLMGLRRFTKWQQPINPKQLRREIADKLLAENKWCF
jgi:hypothetical protein